MGGNGANFIFRASGARSPFGSAYVSGSHCGNRAYWAGTGGGYSSRTSINIKQYNYGGGGCYGGGIFGAPYMGGYYGGGCCGGGGISEKSAWWAFGIGTGVGLLTSPIGGSILRGIGSAFSWVGRGIGKAASWTWNKAIKPAATWTWNSVLKPTGKALWKGISWTGKQIGNTFAYLGKGLANWFTGKKWSTNNEWDKCGANK